MGSGSFLSSLKLCHSFPGAFLPQGWDPSSPPFLTHTSCWGANAHPALGEVHFLSIHRTDGATSLFLWATCLQTSAPNPTTKRLLAAAGSDLHLSCQPNISYTSTQKLCSVSPRCRNNPFPSEHSGEGTQPDSPLCYWVTPPVYFTRARWHHLNSSEPGACSHSSQREACPGHARQCWGWGLSCRLEVALFNGV